MNTIIKQTGMLFLALLVSCIFVTGSMAAHLEASTSVTIVNVTSYPSSYPVEQFANDWPSADATLIPPGLPNTQGYELYLNDVTYTTHSMHWTPTPYPSPYWTFYNTINSMIAAVYSEDGGKTFALKSWDYLQSTTTGKGTEAGMPDCWMGAMVHTLCGRKAGECNGEFRSNLYFSEWPEGNTNCWASSNPQ